MGRQEALTKELITASEAYYNGGRVTMSDREFDQKVEELKSLEAESGIVLPGSPTQNVGARVDSLKKIRHEHPALSLDKVKYENREDLVKWVGNKQAVMTWKWDGLTVVVTYDNGRLTQAVTRGDGEEGSDITHNARYFKWLPQEISYKGHLVVRGEALMTYEEFERVNTEAGGIYENPRNLAAATIQMLDAEESRKREIRFIVFELVSPGPVMSLSEVEHFKASIGDHSEVVDPHRLKFMSDRLQWLDDLGFEANSRIVCNSANVLEKLDEWKSFVRQLALPTDGLVFSYQDLVEGWAMGTTGHHPRWAIALKWTDETVSTVIRDVQWSVGKTGIITPVAVFDEVRLGLGSNVTRASLHNISIMESMPTPYGEKEPVRIGSQVEVYLANMIIPQVATVTNTFDGELTCPTKPVQIPDVCPVCGGRTEIRENNGVRVLYCTNEDCPAQQVGKLVNALGKDGLNVWGLSEKKIAFLLQEGYIEDVLDVYRLKDQGNESGILKKDMTGPALEDQPGWEMKSVDNLLDAIEKSRKTTLQKFLYSLNIPLLGNDLSKKLSKYWNGDIDAFKAFVERFSDLYNGNCVRDEAAYADGVFEAGFRELSSIDGIGNEKARNIMEWVGEVTAYRERYEDFIAFINELKFPKTELQEIAEAVNMDEFEPVDTEGHTMEGTVTYKDRIFFVHVSFCDSAKTWEEAVAKDVLRQMKEDSEASSLEGLTFVITGSVHQYKNRDEFKASVEARGGKVAGSVSKNTAALICNEKSSSNKSKKAAELSVPVLTEDEFIAKYGK